MHLQRKKDPESDLFHMTFYCTADLALLRNDRVFSPSEHVKKYSKGIKTEHTNL